ncbi:TetR/AcrR family transcriptional regulator [Psychrobacter sp. AOP22-C1-22]|uniref:TetR/AcrR family transcriptional regulator n=1 Tax=unclassified Psychrobacter TaxID=196806 RepID=UPI00264F7DCA|nr:TetR/AcrR family transcriptional regulator [Tetragenococcus koreensis]
MKRAEQERSLQTKNKILSAALSEFASTGFDGVSTRAIAKKAEVNHTLISHHFGSKEALWKATAKLCFEIYSEHNFEKRRNMQDAEAPTLIRVLLKEIRVLLKDFINFCANYPDIHHFLIQANQGDSERLNWFVENYLRTICDEELDVIRRAQKLGLAPQGDSMHIRYLLLGAATSIYTFAPQFARLSGKDPFSDEFIEQHVDYVLTLFTTCTKKL